MQSKKTLNKREIYLLVIWLFGYLEIDFVKYGNFSNLLIDSEDSLTNKTITNQKWAGTISDASSNLLASVGTGKVTYASGSVVLDNAYAIDQGTEKTLEAMMERVARKNQMILGD